MFLATRTLFRLILIVLIICGSCKDGRNTFDFKKDLLMVEPEAEFEEEQTMIILKKDSSRLAEGDYKYTFYDGSIVNFTVNQKGNLDGLWTNRDTTEANKAGMEVFWKDGKEVYWKTYNTDGVLDREHHIGIMPVMFYDSVKNDWRTQQLKVAQFTTHNPDLHQIITYLKHEQIALKYYHSNGKIKRDDINYLLEKEFDTAGHLMVQVSYDWKQRQMEKLTYNNGILISKSIQKGKDNVWRNDGILDQKGVQEYNLTVYDPQGKIVNREIYQRQY